MHYESHAGQSGTACCSRSQPLCYSVIDSNQCKFEILNKALAYGTPAVTFRPTLDLCASSLQQKPGAEALVTISATTLRDIISEQNFRSFNLICDIEGSEWDLVVNEADSLQKAAIIVLEIHARVIGEARTYSLMNRLDDLGSRAIDQEETVVVLKQFRAA